MSSITLNDRSKPTRLPTTGQHVLLALVLTVAVLSAILFVIGLWVEVARECMGASRAQNRTAS